MANVNTRPLKDAYLAQLVGVDADSALTANIETLLGICDEQDPQHERPLVVLPQSPLLLILQQVASLQRAHAQCKEKDRIGVPT
jgi:hypothetical protein